jgi:hypothetical protein
MHQIQTKIYGVGAKREIIIKIINVTLLGLLIIVYIQNMKTHYLCVVI